MESRRSCVFCRLRKMRCSGEIPRCKNCHSRQQNCTYESHGATSATTSSKTEKGALGSRVLLTVKGNGIKTSHSKEVPRTFREAMDELFEKLPMSEVGVEPPAVVGQLTADDPLSGEQARDRNSLSLLPLTPLSPTSYQPRDHHWHRRHSRSGSRRRPAPTLVQVRILTL